MRKDSQTIAGRAATSRGHGIAFGLAALVLAFVMTLTGGLQMAAGGEYNHSPYPGEVYSGNEAARLDGYMRPSCFGALIYPAIRSCDIQSRYGWGDDFYGHWSTRIETVNCNGLTDHTLDTILERLAPGSTLRLVWGRAHSRGAYARDSFADSDLPDGYEDAHVCDASLHVSKSLIIEADPADHIVLKSLQGQSCVRIEPSADKVIIRNLTLISTRGGRSSCVSSSARETTIENSTVRYDGDGPAVAVDAGRFNIDNSNIIARTKTAALDISNASIYGRNTRVASTYNGLKADLVDDSRLLGVSFIQLGDWQGFERGEDARAIDVNLSTTGAIVTFDQLKTLFFGSGLTIGGVGEALVSNSLFYSDHAINSSLDRIRILHNYIFADEVGIHVDGGKAYVGDNDIRLVRTAGILASNGAQLRNVDNRIETETCDNLQWGDVDPAYRTCTPWYKDPAFNVPGGKVAFAVDNILAEICIDERDNYYPLCANERDVPVVGSDGKPVTDHGHAVYHDKPVVEADKDPVMKRMSDYEYCINNAQTGSDAGAWESVKAKCAKLKDRDDAQVLDYPRNGDQGPPTYVWDGEKTLYKKSASNFMPLFDDYRPGLPTPLALADRGPAKDGGSLPYRHVDAPTAPTRVEDRNPYATPAVRPVDDLRAGRP